MTQASPWLDESLIAPLLGVLGPIRPVSNETHVQHLQHDASSVLTLRRLVMRTMAAYPDMTYLASKRPNADNAGADASAFTRFARELRRPVFQAVFPLGTRLACCDDAGMEWADAERRGMAGRDALQARYRARRAFDAHVRAGAQPSLESLPPVRNQVRLMAAAVRAVGIELRQRRRQRAWWGYGAGRHLWTEMTGAVLATLPPGELARALWEGVHAWNPSLATTLLRTRGATWASSTLTAETASAVLVDPTSDAEVRALVVQAMGTPRSVRRPR